MHERFNNLYKELGKLWKTTFAEKVGHQVGKVGGGVFKVFSQLTWGKLSNGLQNTGENVAAKTIDRADVVQVCDDMLFFEAKALAALTKAWPQLVAEWWRKIFGGASSPIPPIPPNAPYAPIHN